MVAARRYMVSRKEANIESDYLIALVVVAEDVQGTTWPP